MTDEDIISKITGLFDVAYQSYQAPNLKWKKTYIVAVSGLRAVNWMKKLNHLWEQEDKNK